VNDLNPRVRLGVFAALLVMVFGVAYGIGAAGEPVDHRAPMVEPSTEGDHEQHG
jgi:hypothetical protein